MATDHARGPLQASSPHRRKIVARLNARLKPSARKPSGQLSARLRARGEFSFGGGLAVARYSLGNGLGILLLADHSAPVLSYHTWFRVGSKHEKRGKTGLAHLFEHLMFGETEQLRKGQLDRLIETAGGETNAATWVDWTHYHSELPASELPLVVRIEADRMQHLVLRKPQVVSEKEVVANERRYRVDDDIEGQVSELLYSTAFTRHPYSWPTIGWMKDIEGFTTEDCEHFYRTYYAPNNATLVVAGDIEEEQVLSLVQEHYGAIPASRIPQLKAEAEPPQRKERHHVLRLPTPTAKVALGYHAPSFGDADYPALSLLSEVLFGGRSSRLFGRLVRDEELVADLHGSASPFVDPGLYEIWLSLRPGKDLPTALRIVETELSRLRDQLVPQSELDKVKNRVELGFLQGLETTGGRAEQLGFFETVAGDAEALFQRLEALRAVKPRDIQRVARRVFETRRRTRIEVVPSGEVEP